MPFNFSGDTPAGAPTICGRLQSDPASFAQSVSDCLTGFDFVAAGNDSRVVGTGVPLPGTANSEYIEQYYHCGIELGDQFRSRGTSIFSISLGAVPAADPNDPYQNVMDANSRKDIFLRRLSMDSWHGSGDPTFSFRTVTLQPPDPHRAQRVDRLQRIP